MVHKVGINSSNGISGFAQYWLNYVLPGVMQSAVHDTTSDVQTDTFDPAVLFEVGPQTYIAAERSFCTDRPFNSLACLTGA